MSVGGRAPERDVEIDDVWIERTRARLSAVDNGPLDAVCLGTPHFSIDEFGDLPVVEVLNVDAAADHGAVDVGRRAHLAVGLDRERCGGRE